MRVYIAGPLFNPGERWFDEQIEACAVRAGLETFLPHRDGKELFQDEGSPAEIFRVDVQGIDQSDIVIANLNGISTDDGTAWELGYAYANGKHLVGVYIDVRRRFEHWTVNIMLDRSLHKLVYSLDELETYLQTLAPAEK